MHRPFVTTVKFENEHGDVVRVEYAVAASFGLPFCCRVDGGKDDMADL
jgi:hypothetical protein